MAWHDITANFVDAVWSGLRKFRQISNGDNTISLEDKTTYTTEGSQVGAAEFNAIADNLNYLKAMPFHDLTSSSTISDADMIPFDTGSVSKYITWANLAKQRKLPVFPNTQLLTTTVDALTVGRAYDFSIAAGNQTASGLPTNRTFVGTAYCYSDAAKIIIIHAVSVNEEWYIRKGSPGWSTWCLRSGELNGTITRNAIMNTSDTIKVVQHGGMATLQMSCRIITAGTYDTSTVLCTSSIKPVSTFSGVMLHGSNHTIARITTNGEVTFNSSTTVAENNWLIGQITFPVKEA